MFKLILAIMLFSGSAYAFEGYDGLKWGEKLDYQKLGWATPTSTKVTPEGKEVAFAKGVHIGSEQFYTIVYTDKNDTILYALTHTSFRMTKYMAMKDYFDNKFKISKHETDNEAKTVTTTYENGGIVLEASEDSLIVTYGEASK